MKILEYLRAGNSPESLTDKFAIKVKPHKDYPNLLLFKYNQIDSPFSEQIVREARGLILDRDDNWNVVSRSFDKFFNHGEGHAAEIDWSSACVQDKLDGSLVILFQYDNKWHVQTSGTPDASGEVEGFGMTFKKLFWQTWEKLNMQLPSLRDSGDRVKRCFVFELMTKYNKIVCRYPHDRIVHLCTRWINNLDCRYEESLPEIEVIWNWELVKSYPMSSFEEIVEACRQINPMDQEGYVVVSGIDVSATFNRVKVKSPQYVALNNLRDGHGPKRIVEIIRTNETAEFLSYFPEWREEYDKWSQRFNSMVRSIEQAWEEFRAIETQKEFALSIKDIPFSGALFMMRAGKISSVREYLAKINVNNIVEYLEKI